VVKPSLQLLLEARPCPCIREALADGHRVVRQGIRGFLEEAGDVQVVAEASGGQEALAMGEADRPDVLVLDGRMPRLSGVEVTRQAAERWPGVRVLILMGYDDPYVFALRHAAAGCPRPAQRVAWGAFDAVAQPVGGVEEIASLQRAPLAWIGQSCRWLVCEWHAYC